MQLTKTCTTCKTLKLTTDFYTNNRKVDKLTSACKVCCKTSTNTHYAANIEYKRLHNNVRNLRRAGGENISIDKYLVLKETQLNCGICSEIMDKPYLDHDHTTGKIRMLLCHHCNTLLGMARDNTAILASAIDYLNKHRVNHAQGI